MMLDATSRPEDLAQSGLCSWENERFWIGWKGHMYLPGEIGGRSSVAQLAALLATEPLTEAIPRLAGVFGLFVHDKLRGGWQIAGDNAGLYKIFHDPVGVSTSFLELVAARRVGRADLDLDMVMEYLLQGQMLGDGTFVTRVKKLRGHEVLELTGDGIQRRAKKLPRTMPPDNQIILDGFAALARSLEGRKLSVDATGGFDSRVVICLLDHLGLSFELATSGRPGTVDVDLAQRIADLLRRTLYVTGHDLDDLDTELVRTFRAGDGITDVRRFHRDRQNLLARLARGLEVIVHGGGGEYYRDHCFIQDFPFYGSRRVNLQRYYDLRMVPVPLPLQLLTPMGRQLLAAVKPLVMSNLQDCISPTNNQTYDRVYFLLRSPEHFGQHCTNYINMGIDVAAPLLDYYNAMVAIEMSPWRRFFYGWHRRTITSVNPRLAALPTADGFSASSEPLRMLRDIGWFAHTQLRRLRNKMSQRFLGRSSRVRVVGAFVADEPGFIARLRASPHFLSSFERLQSLGIIASDAQSTSLPDIHVGRLMTVGMFLAEIDGLPSTAGQTRSMPPSADEQRALAWTPAGDLSR